MSGLSTDIGIRENRVRISRDATEAEPGESNANYWRSLHARAHERAERWQQEMAQLAAEGRRKHERIKRLEQRVEAPGQQVKDLRRSHGPAGRARATAARTMAAGAKRVEDPIPGRAGAAGSRQRRPMGVCDTRA